VLVLLAEGEVDLEGSTLLSGGRADVLKRLGGLEVDVLGVEGQTRRSHGLNAKAADEAGGVAGLDESLNTIVVELAGLGVSVAVDVATL
jgi:hypothetical protein